MAAWAEVTAERLLAAVEGAAPRLRAITDIAASRRPAPSKWCPKEIIGHLLDSAANNLQRIVRAQLAPELVFPAYEQERWVAVQGYAEASWPELVELWLLQNRRMAALIRRIPEEKRGTPCRIGSGAPVTLDFIAEDYVRHLLHHLAQIPGAGE